MPKPATGSLLSILSVTITKLFDLKYSVSRERCWWRCQCWLTVLPMKLYTPFFLGLCERLNDETKKHTI